DIGKISIPDSILRKPGRLTDEEFEIMKSHSAKGGKIIRETFAHLEDETHKEMAYNVARYHHEKWNGRGYPEGLSGEDIPLPARIMAIADVFDAVSEKRCYREAMPLEKCFDIIEEGRGRDFDPVLTDAFLNIRDEIVQVHKNSMSEYTAAMIEAHEEKKGVKP
ncbi:MAG: HD-GYP domain-containing protein, partial [Oscillospiraceae bacterium]